MQAFFNLFQKIQAFGDATNNSNPLLRHVDWSRNVNGVVCENPRSDPYKIEPGQTKLVFDGTRTTTIGGGTTFASSLSSLDPSRYRFTWTGGADPGFRIDRSLALNGVSVTFTVQANNTVILSVPTGPDFTGVATGDIIFVPNLTTGDASSPVSVMNSGYWQVLAVTDSTHLVLVRFSGADFEATTETVALTANTQLQAFTSSGVQVGDNVDISAGFATATRKTYEIVAVTSKFFEVISTTPIPAETGIQPGAAGLIVYTAAKKFLYIEADQECSIRCNGSSDDTQRGSPAEAGSMDVLFMKKGPTWSLSLVNRATVTANVFIISYE